MGGHALWKFSVTVFPEVEEAVSELLTSIFQSGSSSYTDLKTGHTTVSVFLQRKPAWRLEQQVRAGLARLTECGSRVAAARIARKRLAPQDWSESWKRHFKPLSIGQNLLVRPSWSRKAPRAGQALVVLDPGLSFGTGQHPTTSFCLAELCRFRKKGVLQSLLDIGTGSGILAIAAAKVGYRPVEALEVDPEAVRVAKSNASANGVSRQVLIRQADFTKLPGRGPQFDVVCANLISTLLINERRRVTARVRTGGMLVLAGILAEEFDQLRKNYETDGFKLVRTKQQKEWRSASFQR
jgi:ribosomal protein L11 methyltransferase